MVTVVVLFSLPFSCTMDDEACGGAIGKIFVEEVELKAVSAPSTSKYFSERLVEQRIPATQDSLVFQVRTSPRFCAETLPSNSFKIVWGNTLKACSTPPNVNYSNLNAISIAANDTIQTATKTYLPNIPLNEIFKVWYKNRYVDLVEFKRLTTIRTGFIKTERPLAERTI